MRGIKRREVFFIDDETQTYQVVHDDDSPGTYIVLTYSGDEEPSRMIAGFICPKADWETLRDEAALAIAEATNE